MKYRRFGRTAWQVSEIGYGMWGMAGWTGSEDSESMESLHLAVELGCNFFDTAWIYGHGHSERLLGRLMAAHPGKRLYACTKIPPLNMQWPSRREHSLDECYPGRHVRTYVGRSLTNLGMDALDLVLFHTWEDSWLDDDGLRGTIDWLRNEGVARAVGISLNRWEPWNGIRAVRSGLFDVVQVIYNVFDQNPEDELFPACHEADVAVIARVPFDEGSLTGTLTLDSRWPPGDWRNTYFVPENLNASVDRAEALRPLVPPGGSMAELALRFVLANPTVSTVIPGMRKRRHVEENLAAGDLGPLPDSVMRELRRHRWERQPTEWSQ